MMRPSATSAALDDKDTSFFRIVALEVAVVSVLDALHLGDDMGGLIPREMSGLSGHNAGRRCLFSQRGWAAPIVGRHFGFDFGRSVKADTAGTAKASREMAAAKKGA